MLFNCSKKVLLGSFIDLVTSKVYGEQLLEAAGTEGALLVGM